MSKHHALQRILNDIHDLSQEELEELYGIEVNDDGTVWDSAEQRSFDTLEQWADFAAELEQEDNYGSFTKIGGHRGFDDDY